jgi:hypothetical protein
VASLGETFVTKSYDKKGKTMPGYGMGKAMAAKKMADIKKKKAAVKKKSKKGGKK